MDDNVSIKTIAKKTGFSPTTVSRVVNGHAREYRISEKTEKLILKTCKQYGYEPNPVAVNLRLKKSYTVGLIIPSLDNPFFVNVTSLLNKELTARGYNIILTESYDDPVVEEKMIKQLLSRNVDGLLIVPAKYRSENVALFKSTIEDGVPILCLDRYIKDSDIPFITTDNEYGAYIGVKHLIEKGHTKIACIQGLPDSTPSQDRKKGFLSALEEHNLKPHYIGGDEFSITCGYRETQALLQCREKPTAVFAMSNNIALGVMKAAEENDTQIPQNLSLIGFDNYEFLNYVKKPLTCIAQPIMEISKVAVKVLIDYIEKKVEMYDVENSTLKPKIIYRESVASIN